MTVRAALIGCGRFARRHLEHVARERSVEGLEITVLADVDPLRAETYAAEYDIRCWTGDVEAVLADAAVDAALIVTPPESHVPLAVTALEAGKAVFSEKPLSTNRAQREAVRAALARTGGFLQVGYCFRFPAPYVEAAKAAASAAFSAALVMNQEPGGLAYLFNNTCHAVATVLAMHEGGVKTVQATGSGWPGQAHAAEQFTLALGFEDGSLSVLTCGGAAMGSMMPKWYYKVVGRNGRVAEIASREGWSLWLDGEAGPVARANYHEGHREELRAFVRSVETGAPPAVGAEEALAVDEVLAEAAKELGFAEETDTR